MSQIHLTDVPVPTANERTDVLSFFGTFTSPDLEDRFRAASLPNDRSQARLICAISLISLVFLLNDYLLEGLSTTFWLMASVRLLTVAISIGAMFLASTKSPRRFDAFMTGWAILFNCLALFFVPYRAPDSPGILLAHFCIVLMFYLLLPLPLIRQMIAALSITAGLIFLAFLVNPITVPVTRNAVVIMFVVGNVAGFAASRKGQISRRMHFLLRRDLISSEKHYRSLVNATGSLVWTVLPNGSVDFVNETALDLSSTASMGATNIGLLSQIVHPEDAPAFSRMLSTRLDEGIDLEWTGRLKARNGEYRWVLARMSPLVEADGTIEKWIGTTTDIHEMWTAKIKLTETNEDLEKSIARIKQLEKLLSICSFCKKIRDENGEWQQVERYISNRSETRFSHGVCPTCGENHYGDLWDHAVGAARN